MSMTPISPVPGRRQDLPIDMRAMAAWIATVQLGSGQIPWSRGDKTDPWDHVEAAMGLTIGGLYPQARQAFRWLASKQLPDGSWYCAYRGPKVEDQTRDANMSAYVAVGLYHYCLVTGDLRFTAAMWPVVRRAMEFVLRMQAKGGQIHWAVSPEGKKDPMALLTGSSSILMSLKCALALARILKTEKPRWERAAARLAEAIAARPHLFNMTKARFAMDWFYPVLCGAISGAAARKRIEKGWKKFVVQNLGVKCVSDRPWVTIAESAELVLTLVAMGNRLLAHIVFDWICAHRFDDGTFWCGFTYPDMTRWPEQRLTWTNAVVMMAADALFELTPAGRLFNHDFWLPAPWSRNHGRNGKT